MFGDIGHGFMVLCASSFLCIKSESLKKIPGFSAVLDVRYLLLLMGFFATYCGIIYNDFMSLPIEFFGGSCYNEKGEQAPDCVYPFGFDY
jgi:V-type H+-transporting ATPase subunit a